MSKNSTKDSIGNLDSIIKTDPRFFTDRRKLSALVKSYNLSLEAAPKKTPDEILSLLKVTPPSVVTLSSAKNPEQILKLAWEDLIKKSTTLREILSGKLKPEKTIGKGRTLVGVSQDYDDTSKTFKKLEKDSKIKPGLYYIVIIDLRNSTTAAGQMTPEENVKRIKEFIRLTKKAVTKKSKNKISFLLQQKDASLFIFSNFKDILDWYKKIGNLVQKFNDECDKKHKPKVYKMEYKIAVQAGEVLFNDLDPIALAVDQVFKIEKMLDFVDFAITDRVREIILPRIIAGELDSENFLELQLNGEENVRPLWSIKVTSK